MSEQKGKNPFLSDGQVDLMYFHHGDSEIVDSVFGPDTYTSIRGQLDLQGLMIKAKSYGMDSFSTRMLTDSQLVAFIASRR